jgi:hypothetical protein
MIAAVAATPALGGARAAATPGRLDRWLAWGLGFVTLFSPYLLPGAGDASPRLGDAVSGGIVGLAALHLLRGRVIRTGDAARLGVVALLLLAWLVRDAVLYGTAPAIMPLRWLLALPWVYVLAGYARAPETRYALAFGLVAGAFGNLAVVWAQANGYEDLLLRFGLTSSRWRARWVVVGGVTEVRPVGMWGHPNSSSGVIAIGFPILLGMVDEGRLRTWWVAVAFLLVVGGMQITFTRSGLLASLLVFGIWAFHPHVALRTRLARLAGAVLLLAGVLVVGPPGGWDRWTNESASGNAEERLLTTLTSLELAATNPLGLGLQYEDLLAAATNGVRATHNAWIFIALAGGLPLAFLLLWRFAWHALAILRRRTIEGWFALQCFGLFMFEEYFRATPFLYLGLALVALVPARAAARTLAPRLQAAARPWRPRPLVARGA